MVDINQLDPANLATVSAIVAALVTVIGNTFKLPVRYRSLLAIVVAFILVFLPQMLLNKILTALVIGLTASGVYSQVKPAKLLTKTDKRTSNKNSGKATKGSSADNTTSQDPDSSPPIKPYDYRP